MSKFFNILKKLRESKGLMQKDVAKDLGISPAAYSLYEKGQREPKFDFLEKIANYFDVSIDYLMTGEEKGSTENYYLNDDAREMAQFMFDNPEYKVLFDASRKVSKDDIEMVKAIMDKFRADQDSEEE